MNHAVGIERLNDEINRLTHDLSQAQLRSARLERLLMDAYGYIKEGWSDAEAAAWREATLDVLGGRERVDLNG